MSSFSKWMQLIRESGTPTVPEIEQRRRLQLALAVLVIALLVVVVRDVREMEPPTAVNPEPVTMAESANPPPVTASAPANPEPATTPAASIPAPAAPPHTRNHSKSKAARLERPPVGSPVTLSANAAPGAPSIVATDRAVLPPLQVEVVAGGQRKPLAPATNSVNVDMQSGVPAETGQPAPAPPNTSSATPPATTPQVSLSADVAAHVEHSVAPNYPLLAKQMKVQGAVVLQALIDKGGKIQSLRVVSGPAILAAAAEEAVKQWRFKPYYLHGQAVETEARVSVNFTISTF